MLRVFKYLISIGVSLGLTASVALAGPTPFEEYKAIKAEASSLLSTITKIKDSYLGLLSDEQVKSLMNIERLLSDITEPRPGNYVIGFFGNTAYCRDDETTQRKEHTRLAILDAQYKCVEKNIFECNLIKTVITDEINCKAKAFITDGTVSAKHLELLMSLKSELNNLKVLFEFVSPDDLTALRKLSFRLEAFSNNKTSNLLPKNIIWGRHQSTAFCRPYEKSMRYEHLKLAYKNAMAQCHDSNYLDCKPVKIYSFNFETNIPADFKEGLILDENNCSAVIAVVPVE